MSSNAIGTVFRIGLIFISLIFIWFTPIFIGYYLLSLVFGMTFSLSDALFIFTVVVLIRMFYPKNVFKS